MEMETDFTGPTVTCGHKVRRPVSNPVMEIRFRFYAIVLLVCFSGDAVIIKVVAWNRVLLSVAYESYNSLYLST